MGKQRANIWQGLMQEEPPVPTNEPQKPAERTCRAHPKYMGKMKPSKPCRGCWEVYGQAQGWTPDDMRCELEWRVSMWKRLRDQVLGGEEWMVTQ